MRKNLVVQLIYRVVACVVSAFASLLSLGVFYISKNGGNVFSWNFLKYYTNISNYFVLVVEAIILAETVKRVCLGEREGYAKKLTTFRFMTVIMISVTFLVVIFLLKSPLTADYWLDVGNMSYHFLAPLLFILDYILFAEKRTVTVLAPLYSLIIPLIYVGYVFVLGAAIPNFEYPYFFLNVSKIGYGGVIAWVAILLAVFVALGYLLWLWNRISITDGKLHADFSDPLCKKQKRKIAAGSEEPETAENEKSEGEGEDI